MGRPICIAKIMSNNNIRLFLNQHCRFILKSGKEVFGVIWKVETDDSEQYVFTSISDHQTYMRTKDPSLIDNKLVVNIEDIILAERLIG